MDIGEALGLKEREMISLVGAGGKTTTMFSLAEELKKKGKKVLVTTSTAILNPKLEERDFDHFFIGEIGKDFKFEEGSITVYGDKLQDRKLKGGNLLYLDYLFVNKVFDYILIEADGAKRRSIKAPREGEPLVASLNTRTIGLIGLDSLGEDPKKIVHRPEEFEKIVGDLGSQVTIDQIEKLILSDQGLFKNSRGEKVVFLNKADRPERIEAARTIRHRVQGKNNIARVLLGNIQTREFY